MTEHSGELARDESIEFVVQHNPLAGRLRRTSDGSKWALVCRGLTGSLDRRSSLDELADVLHLQGWSSLRFDYRHSLKPKHGESLRTASSMVEDTRGAIAALVTQTGRLPEAVIARGYGVRIALEALLPDPELPLIMWAPILWLRTSLELRGRLNELRRDGCLTIDGTSVGAEFVGALQDPSDGDLREWVVAKRRHVIVHGEEDQVTPLRLATEARDLIESAGGKVELLVLPGKHPHPGMNVQAQIRAIVSNLPTESAVAEKQ